MNITKEMDKNFWKCIGVILVSIITVFFIKMTNCVCHLTSVMDGHFTVRENLTNSTSTDEAAKEAKAEAGQEASQAKEEAGQEASQAKTEADQAASQAKAEASQAALQAKKLKSEGVKDVNKAKAEGVKDVNKAKAEGVKDVNKAKNALSNIFGGSTSSSNDSSSSTGGTTSLTKNLFDTITETSDGGDEKAHDEKAKQEEQEEQEEQAKQDAIIELNKKQQQEKADLILKSAKEFALKEKIHESFTCDINSPTKIVAQYANIESLTKDCDKRIDTCSILKVKDKITGGNLYLDSYKQESYASATGWHS